MPKPLLPFVAPPTFNMDGYSQFVFDITMAMLATHCDDYPELQNEDLSHLLRHNYHYNIYKKANANQSQESNLSTATQYSSASDRTQVGDDQPPFMRAHSTSPLASSRDHSGASSTDDLYRVEREFNDRLQTACDESHQSRHDTLHAMNSALDSVNSTPRHDQRAHAVGAMEENISSGVQHMTLQDNRA